MDDFLVSQRRYVDISVRYELSSLVDSSIVDPSMQRCQTTDAYLVVKLRTISQATFNDPTVVHRSPSGGRFEIAVLFLCMNMRREGAIMVEVRMMQTPCSQRRQWQTCRHPFNLVDRRRIGGTSRSLTRVIPPATVTFTPSEAVLWPSIC